MKKIYYVYVWFRVFDKKVFYVGKGCRKRASMKYGRNDKFNKMINEYECDYKIIVKDISEYDAYVAEEYYIKKYREMYTDINCNISDGGIKPNLDYMNKKVNMYDLNGSFIKSFNSITDASQFSKADVSCIVKCCKNVKMYNSSKGFMWTYDNEEVNVFKNNRTKSKKVLKINTKGDVVKEYSSVYETYKSENIDKALVNRCLNGKQKTTNGYSYRYKDGYIKSEVIKLKESKKIIAKNNNIELIFNSISDANKYFNKEKDSRKIIKKHCENNTEYKGFILEYI